MPKKKALLLGDYHTAVYHPLSELEEVISPLLLNDLDLTATDKVEITASEQFLSYDLCISYLDVNRGSLHPEEIAGLLRFIASGGGFLCLHSSLLLENHEFAQLVGAKFSEHPPYQTLSYKKAKEHPITKGINDFSMGEELYVIQLDPFCPVDVLMTCTNGELTMPAVWCHSYGKGRVVYIAPGHDKRTFLNPMYQQVFIEAAKWALGED